MQYHNFPRRLFAVINLIFSVFTWTVHVRDSSIIRPRCTCFRICVYWSVIQKLSFFVISFPVDQKILTSVLPKLSYILLALGQWTSCFKLLLIITYTYYTYLYLFQEPYIMWSLFLVHMCKMISPANFFIFQNFDFWYKRAKNDLKLPISVCFAPYLRKCRSSIFW